MFRRSKLVAVSRLTAIATVLVLAGGASAAGRVPAQAEPIRESHHSSVVSVFSDHGMFILPHGASYSSYVLPDGASYSSYVLPDGASYSPFVLPAGASYGLFIRPGGVSYSPDVLPAGTS